MFFRATNTPRSPLIVDSSPDRYKQGVHARTPSRKFPPLADTSWLSINLDAIRDNVRVVRSVLRAEGPADQPGICAVLKADGYGLGAAGVAPTLEHAGVDMIAVYTLREAASLLLATTRTPILVLMPTRAADLAERLRTPGATDRLRLTIHSVAQLDDLRAALAGPSRPIGVHVEVDTGMSRGGASPAEAAALVREIVRDDRFRLAGVFSHFASADCDASLTEAQARRFDAWLDEVADDLPRECVIHQANTFGALRSSKHHRGMARVGLALLGYAVEEFDDPSAFQHRDAAQNLRPAVRWESRVIHESRLAIGSTAGYGGAWRATRPSRLGLVPLGYADGYPLSLSNRGVVRVQVGNEWHPAPIVGRVSMDQITIDLTDLPADARIGSLVEALGDDRAAPSFLPTVAHTAGTITHELLCRLSPRVARRFTRAQERAPTHKSIIEPLRVLPKSVRPIAVASEPLS
jgi:alanine racemase